MSENAWIPRAQIFSVIVRDDIRAGGAGPRSERGGRMAVEPGARWRGAACLSARPGDDRACQTVCRRARKCKFTVPVSYMRVRRTLSRCSVFALPPTAVRRVGGVSSALSTPLTRYLTGLSATHTVAVHWQRGPALNSHFFFFFF